MHELREPAKMCHVRGIKSHIHPVQRNEDENESIIINKRQFLVLTNANNAPLLTSVLLPTPPRRTSFDKATSVFTGDLVEQHRIRPTQVLSHRSLRRAMS